MEQETITVYDGKRKRLAEKAVSGSEGTVCFVGRACAVKLYHTVDEEKIEKVRALIAKIKSVKYRDRRFIKKHMAIPTGIITDCFGNEIGFKMKRFSSCFDHHEVVFLDNKRCYVKRYAFACRLSRLAKVLHRNGILIGDFNRRNFLSDINGRLVMVDADTVDFSYGGKHYKCTAYLPETVTPEVHKQLSEAQGDYRSSDLVIFNEETDDYSLAYTVFKLIALGSPYACVPSELSEHERISEGICPIYRKHADYKIPGYVVKKRYFGIRLNSLFKRVFVKREHITAAKLYRALRARTRLFDYQLLKIKTYGGDTVY